jgi:hypothetical protein
MSSLSKLSASDSPSTAHLVSWYRVPEGKAIRPPIDEMLTVTPEL